MSSPTLLVTGASGQLGRRIVQLLLDEEAGPIIAPTRDPASLHELAARGVEVRAADFDRPAGLLAAFRGAARAVLISTDAIDRPGHRLAQHLAAVHALEAAGVEHVVYTSLTNPHPGSPITIAGDHRETEAALAASRLDFTILRNNCYTDLMLSSVQQAVASGRLIDARGDGATGFVTREDCARAAAAALAATTGGRRTLDVTGPAAVTSAQVAAIASELTGRPVEHVSVPRDALVAGMVEHGLPGRLAELLASFDVAIAANELAVVSGTVEELTGRVASPVRDFLTAHRGDLVPG